MSDFREVTFSPLSPSSEAADLGTKSNRLSNSLRLNLDEAEESAELKGGQSTYWGASFNFINSIVGAGIIGIPLAIQQCGFVLGMFLLALVAALVRTSAVMLIDCGLKNRKRNLEELSEHLLGPFGYYLAVGSMFLYAYGGQIAYLIIVGDTIPLVTQLIFPTSASILYNRQFIIGIFGFFIILPLCLLRDMGKLEWTSFLSISADMILIIIVLVASFSATKEQSKHFQSQDLSDVNSSLFSGIGTMSFAFVCQHNSFLVFQTLKNPTVSEWALVANISIAFSYFLCLFLGLIGFFAFFPNVQGDLLNNFPVRYVEISVARALLGISMIFTYPMESFVTRHCLLTTFHRWRKNSNQALERRVTEEHIEMTTQNQLHESNGLIEATDLEQQPSTLEGNSQKKGQEKENVRRSKNINYIPVNQNFFTDEISLRNSAEDQETIDFQASRSTVQHEKHLMPNNTHVFSRRELTIATLILWGSTLSISLLYEKLGVATALTGVLAASNLGYTLPALIYIKTYYDEFLLLFQNIFIIDNPLLVVTERSTEDLSEDLNATQSFAPRRIISRMYSTILMINLTSLKIFIWKFGISLFMIIFGIAVLFIGVITILADQIF